MPRMFKSNRRRFTRHSRQARGLVRRVDFKLTGGFVRGPSDPRAIATAPWNSVVLSCTLTSDKAGWLYTSIGQLRTVFFTQLGIPNTTKINMRILRMSIWNDWASRNYVTAGTVFDQFLAMRVLDFSLDCTPTLANEEDGGTNVIPPHLHYIWPQRLQNYVICSATDRNIFGVDCQKNLHAIAHVHIMWRTQEFDPLPSRASVSCQRPRYPSVTDLSVASSLERLEVS